MYLLKTIYYQNLAIIMSHVGERIQAVISSGVCTVCIYVKLRLIFLACLYRLPIASP
jgi:hypothetical protein